MWQRLARQRLRALWRQFPAVLILGARQVGKTTLARQMFPRLPYLDLEEPKLRELFTADPSFQLESRARRGMILDEAQSVTALFPALRGAIDADRAHHGRFLLLGSAQPALVRGVSESLAGRVGILELDPLVTAEVTRGRPLVTWRRLWLTGGRRGRAWLLHQDAVTSVIIGAKRRDQLDDNLRAPDVKLTADEARKLDEVSALPAEYPGWMLSRQGADRVPAATPAKK